MSHNFYLHMRVKFTCVNKTEVMSERPRVNVKVERVSAFALDLLQVDLTRVLASVACFFAPKWPPF